VCGLKLVRLKVVLIYFYTISEKKAFAYLQDTLHRYRSSHHYAVFIRYRNFSYPWSIPNFLVLCAINSHFGEPTTPVRPHPP